MNLSMKKWKPVVGYEGLYEISNFGQVRSVGRTVSRLDRWGGISKQYFPSVLMSVSNHDRYPCLVLKKKKKRTLKRVHRLVLEAFVGPCPPGKEACHKDDDKTNNNLSNLYWGTHKRNLKDAHKNGRYNFLRHNNHRRGEKCSWSKLTNKQVRFIKTYYKSHKFDYGVKAKLARKFNVTISAIRYILDKDGWKCTK